MTNDLPDITTETFLLEGKLPETIEELQAKVKEITETKENMSELMALMKKVIAKNPRARSQLVEELGGTLPSIKGHAYYSRKAANFIKPFVDKMMENGYGTICFAYNDYKNTFSQSSLKQFIYHGLRYLIENLDTADLKYESFRMQTMIKTRAAGVFLVKKDELELKQLVHDVTDASEVSNWKLDFTNFLENSEPGEKFIKDKLILAEEDINFINAMLTENDSFLYSVSTDKIKVVHLKEGEKD